MRPLAEGFGLRGVARDSERGGGNRAGCPAGDAATAYFKTGLATAELGVHGIVRFKTASATAGRYVHAKHSF